MKTILFLQKNLILFMQSGRATRMGNRVVLVLMGSMLMNQAQSQADKRLLLADQYFAAGEYFTAASLYAQFLNPAVKTKTPNGFPLNVKRSTEGNTGTYGNKTDIRFRQAASYRLANYCTQAASLYKACYEKDAVKYAAALYWYAVCQRSTGNYAVAEESIDRFLIGYPGNPYYQAAEKEKQTIQFIKSQLARPDSMMYQIQKLNTSSGSEKGFFAPVATRNDQLLITSTQKDSVATGINPFHNRLFHSQLTAGGLQNLEPVIIDALDSSFSQGAACLSANGSYLYFTQWKNENGRVISSIYYSRKIVFGWSQPQLLASVNQEGYNSRQPFCTADGKYLFFASDRTGGLGKFDIWYAPILENGSTGQPVNAGELLNSPDNEQTPFYHSTTGTLVFSSDRMPGMGGYDLFSSKGWGSLWKAPENMGHPVNSARDDVYFFSAGNGGLLDRAYLSSDRGSECCLGTYLVTKASKKKIITGQVRDCNDNEAVADAEVILQHPSGEKMQATTNAKGEYSFEFRGEGSDSRFFVRKEKYSDKTAGLNLERTSELNWQTDTLFNTVLCLEKKFEIKVENVVSIYFDFDRSQLNGRGMVQLDSIYTILSGDSSVTIQISGYTDGKGSVAYNKKLSDKRAKACADYLVQKGLDAARIGFESFGACCPIEMELINGRDNPDGRSMNRRALINISKE